MSDNTGIEWTDATWSPLIGCTRVSPGCDHCYAITTSRIRSGNPNPKVAAAFAGTTERTGERVDWTGKVNLLGDRLDQPLRWRKPRRIFVNSMSDLFHEAVPDEFIARVFAIMALAPRHTFQVLTKRHARMRALLSSQGWRGQVEAALLRSWVAFVPNTNRAMFEHASDTVCNGPLPNVWLGVSVESQQWADIRIPALLDTPAAVRFLSCEPLLGPVDLYMPTPNEKSRPGIDWVIVGGESGPGARPMHPDWARSLRDQCQAASVPFLFKQWGEYAPAVVEDDAKFSGGRAFNHPLGGRQAAMIRERSTKAFQSGLTRRMESGDETKGGVVCLDDDTLAIRVGKKAAGRELDGRTWDEYPTTLVGAS